MSNFPDVKMLEFPQRGDERGHLVIVEGENDIPFAIQRAFYIYGSAWLDTGTMDSLVDAADFVRMIEKRQSIKISAPEEIAYINGWINKEMLLESASRYGKSPYGEHLHSVADGKIHY